MKTTHLADKYRSKPIARRTALFALTQHKAFRLAHPREDHFVPIYVAAGAGEEGSVHLLSGHYGCQTVAFGI
jgi:aromatic ring-opening dioxygenase catalytic subunit (LigB family)